MTFKEVYEIAVKRKLVNVSQKTIESYKIGYKYCEPIAKKQIVDIKSAHMQAIIDKMRIDGKSSSTLSLFKKVCDTTFNYAVQNDLVNKQYSSFVQLGK